MRLFSKFAVVVGLAACLGTSAQAQGPGGRGGMMGGPGGGMLWTNKSVQKELKLSDEQVTKVDKAVNDVREKFRDQMEDARELQGEERMTKMQSIQKEMAAEAKKSATALLSPEQVKRYDEIALQAGGLEVFSEEHVQKKLSMTDEQKAKIKAVRAEAMTKMGELRQSFGNDREAMMKKMQEARKEVVEKAHAVLTSEQKTTWKEMIGEPFEVKYEAMRGGRGPGQ